jgi:Zn-dependent protease
MTSDFLYYLCSVPGIVLAMSLHEYVKAACSASQGDPLPKARGRVTLNPLKQIEPIGFLCMFIFGYGWSRPLDTSPTLYRDWRRATVITYVTPSVVNLCVGLLLILATGVFSEYGKAVAMHGTLRLAVYYLLLLAAKANISLALFQFVPVFPLNVSKLLPAFLPPAKRDFFRKNQRLLQMFLIALLCVGAFRLLLDPVFYLLAAAV